MTGGSSYSCSTRVGNWNEDLELLIQRNDPSNDSLTNKMDRKYKNHTTPVSLVQQRESPYVQFGEPTLIFNEDTNGFLSVDLDNKLHSIKERYGVSTASSSNPLRRNTFSFVKYESEQSLQIYDFESNPNTVHFGQLVHIKLFDSEIYDGKDLFLRSERVTPSTSAPITTTGQEVSVEVVADYSSVWKIVHRDQRLRLDYEGTPVKGNTPICLVHAQTGEFLASQSKVRIVNDFGGEFEVCGKTIRDSHKAETISNSFYIVVGGIQNT